MQIYYNFEDLFLILNFLIFQMRFQHFQTKAIHPLNRFPKHENSYLFHCCTVKKY